LLDDCGRPEQPVILESELPGEISRNARERELVARALRPPPPYLLLKQEGRWPTQQLRIRDRKSMNRQLTSAKAALLSSAVGLKQSRHRFPR
jgi:hypothetical protein